MDKFNEFLAGRHPKSKILGFGRVSYLDFKERPVEQDAVLIRGYPYDQEWAWAIDSKGKVASIHPMYYKPANE